MGDVDELAAAAYAAYVQERGSVDEDGRPLLGWADLTAEARNGWRAAVRRVVSLAAPYEVP